MRADGTPAAAVRPPLRFLLIEDNPDDVDLMDHELRRAGFDFTLGVVQTADEFRRELRAAPPDVVMADYNLPAWTGMDGLGILLREELDIPFILVTGALGDVTAVDCIKRGASDYVLKGALRRLPVSIRTALRERQLRRELDTAEQEVEADRERQLRFKDEFLSHVAHEVRSPLTVMMQFTQLMLDGLAGDLTGTQRGYEEIVLQSGRQMRTMLDALVDVTRLENGTFTLQPAHVSMSDAIADAIERCREKADAGQVSLWSPLKRDLPLVVADPDRLRQILGILLDNAIRCTPAGGAVVVHVRSIDTDPDALGVDVADSGSGIEPTRLARIFDRVYETLDDCRPSKALGLGLCICRHLVALHGGRTWVRSTPGRGSTFSFTVPVAPEELLSGGWPDPSLAHGRPA